MSGRSLALGLAAGVLADRALGDPQRGHPVALFGSTALRLESLLYKDSRAAGTLVTAACVGATAVLGRLLGRGPVAVAAATWAVLGSRTLQREATAVGDLLTAGDLPAARTQLSRLVGRSTEELDEAGVSRAVVESVAENACDAVVAPLVWGAIGGVPGLLGYRAANTLDAMVGHRSPRYERFGWASARLDDAANLLPSRLCAVIAAAAAPVVGGSTRTALRTVRRWGRAHPSPNSGMSEAAFAGALGLRLGGRNVYHGVVDERPVIGDGRPAAAADIERANRLLATTTYGAAAVAAVVAIGSRRR